MTTLTQSIYANDFKKELEELLIKNLPKRIKAGHTKQGSNIFEFSTKYALNSCDFIHYNSPSRISFMIFDFDSIDNRIAVEAFPQIEDFLAYIVDKIGIEPTFITQTNKGYQFSYHFKNHVFTKQNKPLAYLSKIKDSLIELLGCDIHGSARNLGIWRNPLRHKHYFSTCINYELNDFKSLIIPKKSFQKQFQHEVTNRQINQDHLTRGNRNYGLFLLGMGFSKNKKNLTQAYLQHHLTTISMTMKEPLPIIEISSISKSIFNNYYLKDKIYVKGFKKKNINEGVMGFEKMKNLSKEEYDQEIKKRQSLAAIRTNLIRKDTKSNFDKARKEYRTKIFATNLNIVREAIEALECKNEKVSIDYDSTCLVSVVNFN